MKNILFISNNWFKIKIVENIAKDMDIKTDVLNKRIDVRNSESLKENIIRNLNELYQELKKPVLIAKSGLYLDDYPNFPGVHTSFISHTIGMQGLFQLIRNSNNASVMTIVGFFDGNDLIVEEFNMQGKLLDEKDNDGWFFDPYFYPENSSVTFSEMSEQEKMKYWERPFRNLLKKVKDNEN